MPSPSHRQRPRFSPLVTVVVVGVWLVLVGSLVKDEYLPSASAITDVFQLSDAESDDWFLIRIRGSYAGFGRSRQFKTGDGWSLRDDLNISLNLQGQMKPVRIMNESNVDKNFRLTSFRMRISSGIMAFEQKGYMEGRDLVLEMPRSQGSGSRRIKLYESPRMSRSLGLPLPLTGLKIGDDFKIPIFDPLDGQKWDAAVRVMEKADLDVAGSKVEAWRVRATYRTVELYMWIDDQGRLLKGAMPLGITVIRSDKQELARELKKTGDLPDFPELAGVPLEDAAKAGDVNSLTSWRLQINSKSSLPVPSDDFRQKLKGDELTITQEKLPESTYTLPCKDPKKAPELEPSRFIQSDNAVIIKTAREIVGNEKDPIKAAQLINGWVYKNLQKVPTPVVPDAYNVLATRQGACNEHAVLAVALARAVGLPARVAVGLVYSEGIFYYHAWVTYWAGDRWFTGDPLMNQLPVNLGHIALLYGDVDKHMNVLAFLGQIHLKLLEAKI